jgi:hypothetical protein
LFDPEFEGVFDLLDHVRDAPTCFIASREPQPALFHLQESLLRGLVHRCGRLLPKLNGSLIAICDLMRSLPKHSSSPAGDRLHQAKIEAGTNLRRGVSVKIVNMPYVSFTCPATGLRVRVHFDEVAPPDNEIYVAVNCVACRLVHLVNPADGSVRSTPSG